MFVLEGASEAPGRVRRGATDEGWGRLGAPCRERGNQGAEDFSERRQVSYTP